MHRRYIVRQSKVSHLKLFLAPSDILLEFWRHPNPNGSFNWEPDRAKMAAKPPFFASSMENEIQSALRNLGMWNDDWVGSEDRYRKMFVIQSLKFLFISNSIFTFDMINLHLKRILSYFIFRHCAITKSGWDRHLAYSFKLAKQNNNNNGRTKNSYNNSRHQVFTF